MSWDDLHHQLIDANTNFGTTADAQTVFRRPLEAITDELGRDEVAELVAIWRRGIFLQVQTNTLGISDFQHATYQLGDEAMFETMQEGAGSIDAVGAESADTIEVFGNNPAGAITEADANGLGVDTIESGVWYASAPHQAGGAFKDDEVNGVGLSGGATMHMDHGLVNFRDQFGGGPTVDRHSDVYEVMSLSVDSQVVVNFYRFVSLFWDIRGRGEAPVTI